MHLHFPSQGHTLSTMRKFSIFSPSLQATSPASLTASGKSSFTSWAIIPVHMITETKVRKGSDVPLTIVEFSTLKGTGRAKYVLEFLCDRKIQDFTFFFSTLQKTNRNLESFLPISLP